ncbi:MAG: polyprenyl synthetase family protein, partial [Candidatus Odinarchaeota archaeon]
MRDEEFLSILSAESSKAERQLRAFLEDRAVKSDFLGQEHKEFYLNLEEFILRGGKRLRPVAFIMAYKSAARVSDDKIYLPSISIELLHNATLVHDDIMDKDEFRRGVPTVHVLWGIPLAILAGDLLLSKAFEIFFECATSPKIDRNRLIDSAEKLAHAITVV